MLSAEVKQIMKKGKTHGWPALSEAEVKQVEDEAREKMGTASGDDWVTLAYIKNGIARKRNGGTE